MYMGKAEEFIAAAQESLDLKRSVAATSLAVHAGINACDAFIGAHTGRRPASGRHEEAIDMLRAATPDGKSSSATLGRLLSLKTRAEYDPAPIPQATAQNSVRWATKILEAARRSVAALD